MTYIIIRLLTSVLSLLEFLMFARAIFSWFPQASGSRIGEFLYNVTEPLIMPFRALFERFPSTRMMPIDIPFFCAFLVLIVLQRMLYSL